MKLIEQVLYDEQKRCNYMEVLNNTESHKNLINKLQIKKN
jgi:hypothetical protein